MLIWKIFKACTASVQRGHSLLVVGLFCLPTTAFAQESIITPRFICGVPHQQLESIELSLSAAQYLPVAAWVNQFPRTQYDCLVQSGVAPRSRFVIRLFRDDDILRLVSKKVPDFISDSQAFRLPETFVPPFLEPCDSFGLLCMFSGLHGRFELFSVLQVWQEQTSFYPQINSVYRSYEKQESNRARYQKQGGAEMVHRLVAEPGYSEHQTGLAVDVWMDETALKIPRLFARHFARLGLVQSYQFGQNADGYAPEWWHLRFVGVAVAAEIEKNGTNFLHYAFRALADRADLQCRKTQTFFDFIR